MQLFLLLFFCFGLAFAQQNVLILNSYNQGYAWTDEIIEEIWNVLKETDDVNIHIEHMDILNTPKIQETKNNEKQNWGIYSRLENKYKNVKFNVVITVEYAAFEFAKKYANNLWEDTPIVSSSINKIQYESIEGTNLRWSGIYNFYDITAQVYFLNLLQKDLRRVVFITDNTYVGHDIRQQISSTISTKIKSIDLEEWRAPNLESLSKFLSPLDPKKDAVVIACKICINLQDSVSKSQMFLDKLTQYVSEHSAAPVYSFWDVGTKFGVIGGNIIYGSVMGKNTGLMASAILAENEEYNSGFYRSINIPTIDEQAAIQEKLDLSDLPPETAIINKAQTFASAYQNIMSNMVTAIIAELVVILVLMLCFYIFFKISNSKLKEEKREVEKANKAKSLFLANMSHEIRTPLNSILGFADLLYKNNTELTKTQKEWCKSIQTSAFLLRDTFNNVLNYSKIESEGLKIEEEWFDIFALCDDLISVCKHNLLFKQIKFYVMPSIYLPRYIKTDSIKLKQVLVNLINNALKFTNRGSVKLILTLKHENDNNYIFFEVIDSGIGIPQDKTKQIFNAFEQLEYSRSKKYGGSGLGLTISQSILQAMNSGLRLDSDRNGSRFYFTLPLKVKEEAFYTKYLNAKNQKISIHFRDPIVSKYMVQCVEAIRGIVTETPYADNILNLTGQDLLIAEIDNLSDAHLQKIAEIFPRVILIFYKESEKFEELKNKFQHFECLFSPMKSSEILEAIKRLYGT